MVTKKSGSPKKRTAPKKLRGDAARAARYRGIAHEAAAVTLNTEAHRRTLLRLVATLVEKLGGEVRIPFRVVAGAPDLGMVIENPNTPRAMMVLAVADRKKEAELILEDRVVVHSWSSQLGASEPEQTGLELAGVISAVDQGELIVVRLDQPNALDLPRVIVPKGWARPESTAEEVELQAGVDAIVAASTRVDTEEPEAGTPFGDVDGEADPSR
jgi:hypothetical protein